MPEGVAAPLLPENGAAVKRSAAASLDAEERAFSSAAGKIGLGPAFARFGGARAVNMGDKAPFTVGPDAIAQVVGAGSPPPNPTWGPESVLVAGSGDLGIPGVISTIGMPSLAIPPTFRTSPSGIARGKPARWAYVAE